MQPSNGHRVTRDLPEIQIRAGRRETPVAQDRLAAQEDAADKKFMTSVKGRLRSSFFYDPEGFKVTCYAEGTLHRRTNTRQYRVNSD